MSTTSPSSEHCSPRAQLHLQRLMDGMSPKRPPVGGDTRLSWTKSIDTPRSKVSFSEWCVEEQDALIRSESVGRRAIQAQCDDTYYPWCCECVEQVNGRARDYISSQKILFELASLLNSNQRRDNDTRIASSMSTVTNTKTLVSPRDAAGVLHEGIDALIRENQQYRSATQKLEGMLESLVQEAEQERNVHLELQRDAELRYTTLMNQSRAALESSRTADDEAAFWEENAHAWEHQLRCMSDGILRLQLFSGESSKTAVMNYGEGNSGEDVREETVTCRWLLDEMSSCDDPVIAMMLVLSDGERSLLALEESICFASLERQWLKAVIRFERDTRVPHEEVSQTMDSVSVLIEGQQRHQELLRDQLDEAQQALKNAEKRFQGENDARDKEVQALWDLVVQLQDENQSLVENDSTARRHAEHSRDMACQYEDGDLLRSSKSMRRLLHSHMQQLRDGCVIVPRMGRPDAVLFRRSKSIKDFAWGPYLTTISFACSKIASTTASSSSPNASSSPLRNRSLSSSLVKGGSFTGGKNTQPPYLLILDMANALVQVHAQHHTSSTPRTFSALDIISVTRSLSEPTKVDFIMVTNGTMQFYFQHAYDKERCLELLRLMSEVHDGCCFSSSMVPFAMRHGKEEIVVETLVSTTLDDEPAKELLSFDSQSGEPLLLLSEADRQEDSMSAASLSTVGKSTFSLSVSSSHVQQVSVSVISGAVTYEHLIPVELECDSKIRDEVDILVVQLVIGPSSQSCAAAVDSPQRSASADGRVSKEVVDLHASRTLQEFLGVSDYVAAFNVEDGDRVFVVLIRRMLIGVISHVSCSKHHESHRNKSSGDFLISFSVNETSFGFYFQQDPSATQHQSLWSPTEHQVPSAPPEAELCSSCHCFFFVQQRRGWTEASWSRSHPLEVLQYTTRTSRTTLFCDPSTAKHVALSHLTIPARDDAIHSTVPVHRVRVKTTRSHATIVDALSFVDNQTGQFHYQAIRLKLLAVRLTVYKSLRGLSDETSCVPSFSAAQWSQYASQQRSVRIKIQSEFSTLPVEVTLLPDRRSTEQHDEEEKYVSYECATTTSSPLGSEADGGLNNTEDGTALLPTVQFTVCCFECVSSKLLFLTESFNHDSNVFWLGGSASTCLESWKHVTTQTEVSGEAHDDGRIISAEPPKVRTLECCAPWFVRGAVVGRIKFLAELDHC